MKPFYKNHIKSVILLAILLMTQMVGVHARMYVLIDQNYKYHYFTDLDENKYWLKISSNEIQLFELYNDDFGSLNEKNSTFDLDNRVSYTEYFAINTVETITLCITIEDGEKPKVVIREHTPNETDRKEPTCLEEGTMEMNCPQCHVTEKSVIPALWHDFPSKWNDETNGKHSKTCQRNGCGMSILSYDSNGEPMFSVELNDGTIMTYPQSMNPKYSWEEGNEKFTYSENGEVVLPRNQVKGFYTAWPHKMNAIHDAVNGSYTEQCVAEGCQQTSERWVVVNDEKINTTSSTGELIVDALNISDDSGYNTDATFKVNTASYSRDMTGWGTLCLPFSIDLSNQIERNYKLYALLSASENALVLEEQNGQISAGTPLIVRLGDSDTRLDIVMTDAETIPQAANGSTTMGNEYQLVGTYEAKQFTATDNANDYIIQRGVWMNVAKLLENENTKSVNTKPFRAYVTQLSQTSSPAKQLRMVVNGETTAIDVLKSISEDAATEYYDIQGRRTNGLQKGVNIVKRGNRTQKIIIK